MKIRHTYQLRLEQKLIPQLYLTTELLQLNVLDLTQRIQAELEQNPCLEEIPRGELLLQGPPKEEKEDLFSLPQVEEFAKADPVLPIAREEEEDEEFAQIEAPPLSFWDRLEAQLAVSFSPGSREERIARAILDNLDGLGFLARSPQEIAEELGVTPEEVEAVRQRILRFDPAGTAALDQRELLLVELEDLGLSGHPAETLIREHWDLLKSRGLERTLRELGVSEEEQEEIREVFERLYPAPVEKYHEAGVQYVYPEVIFREIEGEIVVEYPETLIPRLRLNGRYLRLIQSEDTPQDARRFLSEQLRKAKDFLEALADRRNNILKVAEFIAETQKDFLLGKTRYLVPVTQTEAAERLGIPLSTLNRVVNGKYADTPVGVFELKFFFTRGLPQGGGERVSPEYVKERIRALIEAEDPARPLTDEMIARTLRQEGIRISRRTVADYRLEMGIPKSARRRKRK